MIVLSLPETEIQVDGRGHVTGAVQADTSFSHTIIEMFMVEANEAVSRRLTKLEVPHIRRIHPPPAKDDTGSLACLGPLLGQPPPTELDRKSIADLLDTARGLPDETAVNFMLLRALSQACYSTATDEHFALASEHYCHFTSPIRRYPDLAVHRLFDRCVPGDPDNLQVVDAYQEELARQCSSAERRAIQAERDAQRVLLALLMRNHIGETFDGFVTNVTTFGAYVQMRPILAEGLIRVDDFEHDHWRFDRRRGELIGARSNRHVFVGLPVRVRVAAVDILRQEVSLLPVGDKPIGIMMPREAPRKPRSTPNRRPPQRSSGRSPERSPRRRRTRR